jgi:predicted metal-dependent phosphoesterase TrpH
VQVSLLMVLQRLIVLLRRAVAGFTAVSLEEPVMGRADVHNHTEYSYDAVPSVRALLRHASEQTDLDVIAITDHDEIDGALEALELAPRYRVQVIPGVEVSTREGHLLALDVQTLVPRGLTLARTLEIVGEQGGYAVAAHPVGRWAGSLSRACVRDALQSAELASVLVGAEAYNGSLPWHGINRKATALANEYNLATLGCSDSHAVWMVGLASTEFPGATASDFRRAVHERRTTVNVGPQVWTLAGRHFSRSVRRFFSGGQAPPTD